MEKERRLIAIVRIRGDIRVNVGIRKALRLLRLYKKNYCVIVENTRVTMGMIQKIKDYVTFGEIDKNTVKALLEKRGKITEKKPITKEYVKDSTGLELDAFVDELFTFKKSLKDLKSLKPFRLHPPVGGFEREGIKKPFSMGGVLGYRKEAINKLIMRML